MTQKRNSKLFLQGESTKRIAMFLQLKTKPLIEYTVVTATIFFPSRTMVYGSLLDILQY